jgi:small subunit ribosomal protein S6e
MKLNIAYPRNGTVDTVEITEDQMRKGGILGKRLGAEIDGSVFGEQFSGYVFKLRGGQDTEGFPMMAGVAAPARVSLLLKRGAVGYNAFRGRSGERRRKAIRGDIVGEDISILNLTIVKVGPKAIENVTDESRPRLLGPKRVSAIRALWDLPRGADVRKFVVKRKVAGKTNAKTGVTKKDRFKAPKIQRLITASIRSRRVRKVKAAAVSLKESAQQRREWLSSVSRNRMGQRQRKAAIVQTKKARATKAKAAPTKAK